MANETQVQHTPGPELVIASAEDRLLGSLFGGALIAHVPGTRIELKRSGGRRAAGSRTRYRLYGTDRDRAPTFLASSDDEAVEKARAAIAKATAAPESGAHER